MYIVGVIACATLAFWAYSVSSQTRAASIKLHSLKAEIRKEHERISVLKSEWAYLNRPERLRHLVELNFEKLGLVQITDVNYGEATMVPYPSPDQLENLPEIDNSEIERLLADIASGEKEAEQ